MSVTSPTANRVAIGKSTHMIGIRNGKPRYIRNCSTFYSEIKRESGKKVARERTETAPPAIDYHDDDVIKKLGLRKYSSLLKSAHRMRSERLSMLSEDWWNQEYSDSDSDIGEEGSKSWDYDPKKHYKCLCGTLGVVPCSAFLRQMDSTTMNLSHSYISERDIRIMSHFLMNNTTILRLDVSGNDVGLKGSLSLADAIRENVFITDINLTSTNLEATGIHALISALLINRTVTKLNLSGNKLDHRHISDLVRLIEENDYIVDLDLSHNELDELAACKLAPAIARNVSLKRLVLGWNHFRRTGATSIVKAICNNVELLDVDLSWNGLGEDGCRAFRTYLGDNHTLVSLDISNNRIAFHSLGYFIEGLVKNDTLRTLKMHGNPITTEGAEALCIALQHCQTTSLTKIDIHDTPVDENLCKAKRDLQAVHDIIVIHREPVGHRFSPITVRIEHQDYDPVIVLFEYMKRENLRLIDLFRNFDRDQNNAISREEFREGFLMMNITLSEDGLDHLFKKMDKDKNTNVDLHELIASRREATRRQLKTTNNIIAEERYNEMVTDIRSMLAKGKSTSANKEPSPRLEQALPVQQKFPAKRKV
ncbi:leucine-rich repeat-containing protein 74A-like [Ylistrum balloti]|uniref:leucine-rich repeat-containing protein 74A-like n=1 Tax=Ylistrum balloti TaxID=509963 RepID=UPI002905EB1C|nr:leucine-rich repeat-containing protein 74A-like [Ylistrum balloti]